MKGQSVFSCYGWNRIRNACAVRTYQQRVEVAKHVLGVLLILLYEALLAIATCALMLGFISSIQFMLQFAVRKVVRSHQSRKL